MHRNGTMIYPQPLTAEQQRRSRKYYNLFNLINGVSYMCLGETVLILLAVKMEASDGVVAVLGAMSFFSYLMLPLGRILTARVGAVKTQVICWRLRNVAALMVAASSIFFIWGHHAAAMALMLAGSLFFYGFRAAGVVMSQPLVGDIADEQFRAELLAVCNALFFGSCLVALIAITFLLRRSESIGMLTGIITFGAMCGIFASAVFNHVDETATLRNSARKPLRDDLVFILRSCSLRRQIAAGFAINLATILLIPLSMLALKRGYQLEDVEMLKFALLQFGTSSLVSLLTGRISASIGSRKLILFAYLALLLLIPLWVLAPAEYYFAYFMLPFLVSGAATVSATNAITHYFLENVAPERRISVSFFLSIFTGAGAGLAGMAIGTGLLKISSGLISAGGIDSYRVYFLLAAVVLLPGIWFILRLTPLPMERHLNIPKSLSEGRVS